MAKLVRNSAPAYTNRLVANKSSRLGVPVRAVCLHSTESQDLPGTDDDLDAIGNWFGNPKSDASAHVGVDGDGNSHRWVPVTEKAWTALQANPWTANIEFVGRAAQPARDWEIAQLKVGAKWAAFWCVRYGIPAQRGVVRKVNGLCVCTKPGIITHHDVTLAGFGSHVDPGPAFPIGQFIRYVRAFKAIGWTEALSPADRLK